jgi:hypothetical protein
MSLWGDQESVAANGTIEITATTGAVVGTDTAFTAELEVGNFIRTNEAWFVVTDITDNLNMTVSADYLGEAVPAVAAGNTFVIGTPPKSIAFTDGTLIRERDALNGITGENSDVVFIDTTEAGVAGNKAKGLDTGGWTQYRTYQDAQGNTRHKSEVLVAMRRTAAAYSAGVSAGDADDAEAESIAADS